MARARAVAAFSLLETLIAIVIVAILATMLIPVYAGMRERAQRIQCLANLHGLYIATNIYVQRNGSWPQITPTGGDIMGGDFANAWIDTLTPFGPTRKTWICPTIQELLHNPDYSQPQNARIDYMPMSFDDNPLTPHKWPRQPWFIETGNVHGNGNLIIYTDGSAGETGDLVPK